MSQAGKSFTETIALVNTESLDCPDSERHGGGSPRLRRHSGAPEKCTFATRRQGWACAIDFPLVRMITP
jgi:hypothetical protein